MSRQLIKLKDVKKGFGAQTLLDGIFLTISQGDRMALIGENGSGKTTLAKVILDREPLDSGSIERKPNIRIGYLPQDTSYLTEQNCSMKDYLLNALGDLAEIREGLRGLEQEFAYSSPNQEKLDEWNELHEKWEKRGGYTFDSLYSQVMSGLGLTYLDPQQKVSHLSGGEKIRLVLAGLLLSAPDFLVLDEPTNHLDAPALEWLENYLKNFSGAFLCISHDRQFLNRSINQILELSIETHQLKVYGGNYDFYLKEREAEKKRQLNAFKEQQEEIRNLKQLIKAKTSSSAKAKAATDNNKMAYDRRGEKHLKSVKRSVDQAKLRLSDIDEATLNHPIPKAMRGIAFHPQESHAHLVMDIQKVSKSYEGRVVLKEISGEIYQGDRVVIQGSNGCGKTTFLKIILGMIQPDSGIVKVASGCILGYLEQTITLLPLDQTPIEWLKHQFSLSETEVRSELHQTGLISEKSIQRKIGELSLGQKNKLSILALMLSKANVLVLDEPTNHLDLGTLEELEEALVKFEGTVIAVSHDRWFSEKIATKVWDL